MKEERLEVVSMLWGHNISADVMYDSALDSADPDQEPIAVARREGILYVAVASPRVVPLIRMQVLRDPPVCPLSETRVSRQECAERQGARR